MNAPIQKRTIEELIAYEMRAAVLTLPRENIPVPGPADLDAESALLSALLNGHTAIDQLKPLRAEHLYSHFNQHLFQLLTSTDERDPQALADLLDMLGPVVDEITTIRDAVPFAVPAMLRRHVDTIIALWRARQLIECMQRIDAELRVGVLDHNGARARLREHFVGKP